MLVWRAGDPGMTNRLKWLQSPLVPVAMVVLGILWRLVWLMRHRPFEENNQEALNAGIAFAQTGRFADALGPGEGLTAHLSPVMPILTGLVYRAFGIQTLTANWILSLIALGIALGSAILLYRAFAYMGGPRNGRLLALGIYCLLPLTPYTELMEFRHWEGGLAVLLAAGLLLLMVKADARETTGWRDRFAIALLAAILFFVNPPMGLAGYLMATILLWRQLQWREFPATIALAAAVLVAVLLPWTIRNYEAFGRFIPLRGNAGLELALANHPAAVSGENQQAVFKARLYNIHPNNNPPVFARMLAAGGEIPYAEALGTQAKTWIAAHPTDFVRLCVRHVLQFYFPPKWLWGVYADFGHATEIKQGIMWLTAALGLMAAVYEIFVRRSRLIYGAVLALAPALPYMVVQPILRYHYLVLAILLFLSCDFAVRGIYRLLQGARSRELDPATS
jgi:hypothetical protein